MRPDIAERWAAELKSGKYKQTRRHLKDIDGYCCLGVLCEIYLEETGDGNWIEADYTFQNFVTKSETSSGVLPTVVKDWAGMRTFNGGFNSSRALASDNDEGLSFSKIANTILKYKDEL